MLFIKQHFNKHTNKTTYVIEDETQYNGINKDNHEAEWLLCVTSKPCHAIKIRNALAEGREG